MANNYKKTYKWIYDSFISLTYDFGLKIGLTPIGERILRERVYYELIPLVKRNDKILDLGCGTGTLTIMLSKLLYPDCQLFGVDLSKGQIRKAKQKDVQSKIHFEAADAKSLKFGDSCFDIVIISAALHEMDKQERLDVLKEIHRVLKDDGYLLIFEHHEPNSTGRRIVYNFYLGFWEKLLSHSFEIQRSLFKELIKSDFVILTQKPIKKMGGFFQTILCKKDY